MKMFGYQHAQTLGYHRVHTDGTVVLRPWVAHMAGQRLPGAFDDLGPDRGGVLFRDRRPMTPGLQKNNCVDVDGPGYSLSLPRAARGLSISFTNIGAFSVDVFCAMREPHQFETHDDTIDGQANILPFAIAPGASVKFRCEENCRWLTK
jgi:hypothetical protein